MVATYMGLRASHIHYYCDPFLERKVRPKEVRRLAQGHTQVHGRAWPPGAGSAFVTSAVLC